MLESKKLQTRQMLSNLMLLMFASTCCCFQVPIFDLLKKFDGQHTSDDIKAGRRRFRLTKLPSYLVLHIKRFTKNNFFVEKNPTIVNFPVKNLELRDVVPVPVGKPCSASRLLLHFNHSKWVDEHVFGRYLLSLGQKSPTTLYTPWESVSSRCGYGYFVCCGTPQPGCGL